MNPTTAADETALILQLTEEATMQKDAWQPEDAVFSGREIGWHSQHYVAVQEDSLKKIPIKNIYLIIASTAISILGSYIILREVLVDHKQQRGKTVSRLLMGMSVADIILSFGAIMATFVSPKDLEYLYYNVGNIATCEMQAFMMVLGTCASPLFNTTLAFHYLRMIRHNATEKQLARFEPFVHGAIWGVSLATAFLPLPLGWYNNAYETCWVAPVPYDCVYNDLYPCDSDRGGTAPQYYNLFLAFFPSWPCALACAVIMGRIWGTVRHMENANAKYSTTSGFSNSGSSNIHDQSTIKSSATSDQTSKSNPDRTKSNTDRTKSNTVRQQALLYVLAFFATYFFWWLDSLLWMFKVPLPPNSLLDVFAYSVFATSQGFFNALVFVRQREMKTPEGRLFKTIVCCCPDLRKEKKRPKATGMTRQSGKRALKTKLESSTECSTQHGSQQSPGATALQESSAESDSFHTAREIT